MDKLSDTVMETVLTAIVGIIFNKVLEKSGEKLAEAFATQASGAIKRIVNPKAAEALTTGDPKTIDVEVVRVVQQQAESDRELRAILEAMAAQADAEFAREEIDRLKAALEENRATEVVRQIGVTGIKRKGNIQVGNIDQKAPPGARQIEQTAVSNIEGEGDLIIGDIVQKAL